MKKINIAELLKDCPKGMELDCLLFKDAPVYFNRITNSFCYPIEIKVKHPDGSFEKFELSKEGCIYDRVIAKCVIFPKGKTTWEGFVPPCKFKDGDIVATSDGRWIGITTGGKCNCFMPTYCIIKGDGEFEVYLNKKETWQFHRLATEEEKQKLFKAIKDNGYKWNSETKTLEKVPKIKDGDILSYQCGGFKNRTVYIYRYHKKLDTSYYVALSGDIDSTFMVNYLDGGALNAYNNTVRFATEEEKQKLFDAIKEHGYKWNEETKTLDKLIEPKFKVGDKIIHKTYTRQVNAVTEIRDTHYILDDELALPFISQDDYELVPNKFDINTLKPFDKVLVRGNVGQRWTIDFFGFMDNNKGYPFVCVGHYVTQCIPYESNEHLLGTTNDCDEYYKNWE